MKSTKPFYVAYNGFCVSRDGVPLKYDVKNSRRSYLLVYGLNEPTLDLPTKWSDNIFNM
jgi:hypothetical protein